MLLLQLDCRAWSVNEVKICQFLENLPMKIDKKIFCRVDLMYFFMFFCFEITGPRPKIFIPHLKAHLQIPK